ncbi:MAG: sugar transferase [Minisyncoccia bacterium]
MENIFSRIAAIILLIIAFPFLIICILIIRMESKGNPIFKQNRVGKKGEIFTIYKLRTMRLGTEPTHINSAIELKSTIVIV